jgi:hypothetical protein
MFAIIVILIQQCMRWTSWQHFATIKIKIECNKVCLRMCQSTFNFSSCFNWNGKNHQLVAYGHTILAMESFDNLYNIVTFCFEEYSDSLKEPKQPCVAWSTTNSKICQCVESIDVVWLKQLSRALVWTTMMLIRPSTTMFHLGANFHMFSTWKTWFQHIQRIFEKKMTLVCQISRRSSYRYPK